jgi:AraC-like DNA-binding protein
MQSKIEIYHANATQCEARAQENKLGRPRVSPSIEKRIQSHLRQGKGILKVATELGVGTSTVQRIKEEMSGPFVHASGAA